MAGGKAGGGYAAKAPAVGGPGGVTDFGDLTGGTICEYAKRLAQEALGVADADQLLFDFFPIFNRGTTGLTPVATLTGNLSIPAGLQRVRLSTGATAGSLYTILPFPNAAGSAPLLFPTGAAKDWWIAGLFAVVTAVAAGNRLGLAAYGPAGGQRLSVGVHGTTSTANYVAVGDTGAAIDSGVPIDLNVLHLHQFRRLSSQGGYKIDAGAWSTGTARLSVSAGPVVEVSNPGDATNRAIDVVWYAAAAVKEP